MEQQMDIGGEVGMGKIAQRQALGDKARGGEWGEKARRWALSQY